MALTTFNIKCGVMSSEDRVDSHGYKFFTWTVPTVPAKEPCLNEGSLNERIKGLFPEVGDVFNIVCFDDDGDKVILPVENIRETIAALFSVRTKGGVKPVRLCIQPFGLSEPGNCVGHIHFGIECSNCKKKPITGFRYKCRQCPDYNLCGKCEASGVHPEHEFIRMPRPVSTEESSNSFVAPQSSERGGLGQKPSLTQLISIEQLGDRLIDKLTSFEKSLTSSLITIASLLQVKEAEADEGRMEEVA